MNKIKVVRSARIILLAGSMMASPVLAVAATDQPPSAENATSVNEVVVTARNKAEKLQSVPDSITAFTSAQIVRANIQSVADIARLTPGLNFRDGSSYRIGNYDLRTRGIGQGQQGWPAVSVVIDGVPVDSPEAVANLSFSSIEQVEVLRGPQSALYGAGAIAGAINVTTRRPTNDLSGDASVFYGNGNDLHAGASVSGAIIQDRVLGRLTVNYINDDGRFKSQTNGDNLAPINQRDIEARVLIRLTDRLEADLTGSYLTGVDGLSYQQRLPSVAYINTFGLYQDNRAEPGEARRDLGRATARLTWDLGGVKVSGIGAYTTTRMNDAGDYCFDDVNHPQFALSTGGEVCPGAVKVYGNAAQTGQNQDEVQYLVDNYKTYYGEVRAASDNPGPISWIVGASGMHRDYLSGIATARIVAGQVDPVIQSSRADAKVDRWWGVFGQLQGELGRFELTFNGRYDDQEYTNTTYTDTSEAVLVPVTDSQGNTIPTQVNKATSFQPKGQISYRVSDNIMIYTTISRGFRAGYYNSGGYAKPETTVNYEAGIKSALFNHSVVFNVAVFHIDYSNQQVSVTTFTAPFRSTTTVPKTTINGAEAELTYRVNPALSFGASLACLDAKLADGTYSPKAPKFSGAAYMDYEQAISGSWSFRAHVDDSFHTSEYLALEDTQRINANQFLNAKIGVEDRRIGFWFVGTNLTNTQEDQISGSINPYYFVRYPAQPRSYGIEVRAKF